VHLRAVDRVLEDLQGREDVALGLVFFVPRLQTVLVVFFVLRRVDWSCPLSAGS
jgi:hypothetical protein